MKILDTTTAEVSEYLFGDVEISEGVRFSEYKLKKRIMYFKNRHYPTGKITEDGDYEYWFDIIHARVNAEIKNIDFDSKHILLFSKAPVQDFSAVYVINLGMDELMWENGTAEEINSSVEEYSADGNLLFRKTSKGYEPWDMLNTFITNPTAKTVNDTDIIERFYMTQSDLRKKQDIFKNVDKVIEECGNKFFSRVENGVGEIRSKKMYEIYMRTGEISERQLFEAQDKEGGDENKYILARIIMAGIRKGATSGRYVLFAEELKGKMSDYYVEAHRGPYKGRWFREGMYELLMDHQVRYNDITNQIARGLEWASKILFSHTDVLTLQNIRTALDNGSLIKSADIRQIEVRLQGFDQLVNDRNNIIQEANDIANSFEVVQGKNMPASTAFRTAAMMDQNASKLYVFLRQKLSIAYRRVFKEFVIPNLVKSMKMKDVLRVTGDPIFIEKFMRMSVNSWYIKNLAKIGPHDLATAEFIKETKFAEMYKVDPMIMNVKEIWEGVLPRLYVTITGENYLVEEVDTISSLLQYEQDPIRRAYLLDMVYAVKGIPTPPAPNPMMTPQSNPGVGQKQNQETFDVTSEEVSEPVAV